MRMVVDKRTPVPSILIAHRPVRDFLEGQGVELVPEVEPSPLDSLLTQILIDLYIGNPLVIDLAANSTLGATSVLCLSHSKKCRVISIGSESVANSILQFCSVRKLPRPEFRTLSESIPESVEGAIVLVDARSIITGPSGHLSGLFERQDRLIFVYGVGAVGKCPALEILCRETGRESGRRLWLVRESAEALGESRLAVVAFNRHPHAELMLSRLSMLYRGNFRFVDLVEKMAHAAIVASGTDDAVIKTHILAQPLRDLIGQTRHEANVARQNAEAIRRERDELMHEVAAFRKACGSLSGAENMVAELACLKAETQGLRSSLSVRAVTKARRLRRRIAPEGSWRGALVARLTRMARAAGRWARGR